ncbi:MAG: putative penicillin-binding protein [Microgenomates group bacterium Gr01-1014_16]|nr:MAG: putative penicillin-binding protein [Microgenomates group bacterium Gr01-1014_16]
MFAAGIYLLWGLPNPMNLTRHPSPASTRLLDRNGKLIYEIYESQRRTPVSLSSLPKHLINATLAAEDKDFYTHSGFSIRGIARAFINTFFKRSLQGGSTITQQLVKNALLTPDRTVRRKVREFTLSILVEMFYKKDQILELYLNQVPYGGTAYGIEAAAQTYFGKSSHDLSLAESALLAGLPQAPSYYSPFGSHPEYANERQNYVLKQMLDNRTISENEYASASAETLSYSPPPALRAPHFSLWVKDLLINKYGLHVVEQEGLTVTTTLDLDLQEFAQNTVASETAKLQRELVGNGATLVTLPKTGEILAMVGSRDYFDTANDGNVNVVLAYRQPGSSIKPVNYALAFEHRLLTPGTLLNDKPTCFGIPDQKDYCPDNYDNQFHGPTQVRFALGNSFNIPAVKVLTINGLTDFVASSSAFGLTTFKDSKNYGPSLTLGGGEVTMYDMATAYGVFANTGRRVDLNPILQVIDRSGKVLEERSAKEAPENSPHYSLFMLALSLSNGLHDSKFVLNPPPDTRVISPGTAFLISHILYDNGARSATFGSSSYLNIKGHPEVSVKTGTTNDKRDNWTIGYNPDLLTAVWVGNNDNTPLSRIASGVTGAAPIWNKIMTYALKDYKQNWPSQPAEVVGTLICSLSGLKAPENPDPGSCPTRYEYFLQGTIPSVQTDNLRRDIPVFNSAPATPKQIKEFPDQVHTENHVVVFDALGTALCLDCAGPAVAGADADLIRLDSSGRAMK